MSREVCGICWCPYDEDTGECACAPTCPNCASLQDQNNELDRKLADLEQTSLELCETCGWRTVIPGEGCLNCARSKLAELERKPLTEEEIKRIDDSTHFHESPDWSLRFARAIERAHGIGEKE